MVKDVSLLSIERVETKMREQAQVLSGTHQRRQPSQESGHHQADLRNAIQRTASFFIFRYSSTTLIETHTLTGGNIA